MADLLPVPERKPEKKSMAKAQAMMREVMAMNTSRQEMADLWEVLKEMAIKGKNLTAIGMIFDRFLGKPGVGALGTMADNELTDRIAQPSNISAAELMAMRQMAMKLRGEDVLGVPLRPGSLELQEAFRQEELSQAADDGGAAEAVEPPMTIRVAIAEDGWGARDGSGTLGPDGPESGLAGVRGVEEVVPRLPPDDRGELPAAPEAVRGD